MPTNFFAWVAGIAGILAVLGFFLRPLLWSNEKGKKEGEFASEVSNTIKHLEVGLREASQRLEKSIDEAQKRMESRVEELRRSSEQMANFRDKADIARYDAMAQRFQSFERQLEKLSDRK